MTNPVAMHRHIITVLVDVPAEFDTSETPFDLSDIAVTYTSPTEFAIEGSRPIFRYDEAGESVECLGVKDVQLYVVDYAVNPVDVETGFPGGLKMEFDFDESPYGERYP